MQVAAGRNPGKRPPKPAIADIAYGEHSLQKIDIYKGAGAGRSRPVFFLHGGGFSGGSKFGGRHLAAKVAPAGYGVVSVGYRLAPDVDIRGMMHDVAHAIAHAVRHADEFELDTSRIAILGDSAGALLATLIATDGSYLRAAGAEPACIAAIITMEGIFDLLTYGKPAASPRLAAIFGAGESSWRRYSPVTHVPAMEIAPLFYLIHEDTNQLFISQTNDFAKALRARNVPVVTAMAPGLKHVELMRFFGDDTQPMAGFVLECLGKALGS